MAFSRNTQTAISPRFLRPPLSSISRMRNVIAVLCSAVILVGLASISAASASEFKSIYAFTGDADGVQPTTGLVKGPNDSLYGATIDTIYQLTKGLGGDWIETPIYTNRSQQAVALVGTKDNLYASFAYGDSTTCAHLGCILELTPPSAPVGLWTSVAIHNFTGGNDGYAPAGLTIGPSKAIFGVTGWGGGNKSVSCEQNGCGTVFKLVKVGTKWTEKIEIVFNGANGRYPQAAPTFDPTGEFFVTTVTGGGGASAAIAARSESSEGCGSASRHGEPTGGHGGTEPLVRLSCMDDVSPDFIGTGLEPLDDLYPDGPVKPPSAGTNTNGAIIATEAGGDLNGSCANILGAVGGCGVIMELKEPPTGSTPWLKTIVHELAFSEGAQPQGSFLEFNRTTLYGVARLGGSTSSDCNDDSFGEGCGVIYKLKAANAEWKWGGVAYTFLGGPSGATPVGQLLLYKGQILGTTQAGGSTANTCGSLGCGTIFALTP